MHYASVFGAVVAAGGAAISVIMLMISVETTPAFMWCRWRVVGAYVAFAVGAGVGGVIAAAIIGRVIGAASLSDMDHIVGRVSAVGFAVGFAVVVVETFGHGRNFWRVLGHLRVFVCVFVIAVIAVVGAIGGAVVGAVALRLAKNFGRALEIRGIRPTRAAHARVCGERAARAREQKLGNLGSVTAVTVLIYASPSTGLAWG